ncbi:hypothetical protein H2248_005705 [Termitomyces sp. 'cryptogamus']|nr:hypothetical protein H2248_005705 [Termitomyces sp. 'cryptogamus']
MCFKLRSCHMMITRGTSVSDISPWVSQSNCCGLLQLNQQSVNFSFCIGVMETSMTESTSDVPTEEATLEFQFYEKDGQLSQCCTYYKVFGDLKVGTPLIVLHGGPGLCHDYLVRFSDLATKSGIPVILYDQLGNGRSTHLKKMPEDFSRDELIDLFIIELVNLLKKLDVKDSFSLVGHSWSDYHCM